jgi:DNA end-binding protein Ku
MAGAGLIAAVLAANGWLAAARRRPPNGTPPSAPSRDGAPPRSPAPTRDELYQMARRLDVRGRSRMSKAELERAVAERTSQVAPA